jgi:hypothetical protein
MKRQRNYTISERAIIAIGILGEKSLEEINALLKSEQSKLGTTTRELNKSSYEMVKKSYLPDIMKTKDGMWKYINNPKTLKQISEG